MGLSLSDSGRWNVVVKAPLSIDINTVGFPVKVANDWMEVPESNRFDGIGVRKDTKQGLSRNERIYL